MVFYFSGTGNSLWVAKELRSAFNGQPISIANELTKPNNNFIYSLEKEEKVFFVFPVHSWGPAILVLRFIERMGLQGYSHQNVYFVCTCGDNCGYTSKIMHKALHKKGILLTKEYSIQMPNNYVLMKGFDTDPKELEIKKLEKAPIILQEIIENIKKVKNEEIYERGRFAFLKSYVIYPFFRRFAIGKNQFYAKDNCISCGFCADICPTKTISMFSGKPKWNKSCVQCTACIHRCPVLAIEYGRISRNKGRYHHPDI